MSIAERSRGFVRPTRKRHYNSLPKTSLEGALGAYGKGEAYPHGCSPLSPHVCSLTCHPSHFSFPVALALRSSMTARTVTSTPLVATSAPAQLTAPRPSPASMTAPPRNAPPALPTLKAEAVAVADSAGASPAFCRIRTCKPGIAA